MPDLWLLPIVFVFSFLGTGSIIFLARNNHWVDIPNERSSHSSPMPKGGGAAFVIIFIVAVCYQYWSAAAGFNHWLIVFLAFLIALLGLVDDMVDLGIRSRISIQFLVAGGALVSLGVPLLPLFGLEIDLGVTGYVLAALVFLWFINLFNFMDGIDGIAALETLFVCLAVYVMTVDAGNYESRNVLLLLVAAVGGFLLLNIPPAKIFMGDVGSNFLGFMLGVLGLLTIREGLTNIWVWSILLGVFVVDATFTLFKRMIRGDVWYFAHRSHAYQLAAQHYSSHARVDFIVLSINCLWLFPMAWLAHMFKAWGAVIMVVSYLPLIILVHSAGALERENEENEKNGEYGEYGEDNTGPGGDG